LAFGSLGVSTQNERSMDVQSLPCAVCLREALGRRPEPAASSLHHADSPCSRPAHWRRSSGATSGEVVCLNLRVSHCASIGSIVFRLPSSSRAIRNHDNLLITGINHLEEPLPPTVTSPAGRPRRRASHSLCAAPTPPLRWMQAMFVGGVVTYFR
jgi:hypothetical protein